MELSLQETARLLGKSVRQVRYMVLNQRLPARKKNHRWVILAEDLPLSEGQLAAKLQKLDQAANLAGEVIRGGKPKDRFYTVQDLNAFQTGKEIYQALRGAAKKHPAEPDLLESLLALVCGCHQFGFRQKTASFVQAREMAGRALGVMLLQSEPMGELAQRLERDYLPALGGLIRRMEKRRKA